VLDRTERALINLTIRVVDAVRSSKLAKVLSKPVEKLRESMKSLVDRAREIGRPLAEKLSRIAQAWGNGSASAWVEDRTFVEYLGLSALSEPFTIYSM
jgi:NAD-dependent DNA ligase